MFSDPSSQARGAAAGAMSGLAAQAKGNRALLNGILYFLGTVLGFGLLGMAAVRSSWSYPLTGALLQLACLLLGWLYAARLPAWLGLAGTERRWQRALVLLLTAVVAAGVILALRWVPWAKNHFSPDGFATATIPFLLPFFFWEAYQTWLEIPRPEYKLWQYNPLAPPPNFSRIDLNHFMVVHFWMSRRFADPLYHDFTSKAPYEMRLGDLFAIFMTDYNRLKPDQTLQYLDNQGRAFGWLFYAKRPWWRRRQYYDPDYTFEDNFLRQGSIIVAERVPLYHGPQEE
ncbi:TssN family type VI secretion system protein [Hymenobacter sp. UYCo722]|uniref:TssN family type VI secretion system protein n=1 Tax=Hymenobacter sp. UYCo722 TaxID=3156335 RepID=UPI003392F281